jgi:phage replication-related protein YjqB (UPF0714/DUF867 family)
MPLEQAMTVDKYSSYAELAQSEKEGTDYERIVRLRAGALVAIIAPHAGGIEPGTCTIARQIAGADFSLYCFCGSKARGNHELHITSHCFDEPECMKLLAGHTWIVAIHGCDEAGERVFLGGKDTALIADLSTRLREVGIVAETSGHRYPGTDPRNICNRGRLQAGVQIELSLSFRNGKQIPAFVAAVRSVLNARQDGV